MRKQQGFSLVEILVAMAISAIVSVGFLSGLTMSSKAAISTDQMDTGRAIAQAQMEWVRNQNYLSSGQYSLNDVIMAQYPGYSATISAQPAAERDGNIQKIVITVNFGNKSVARLENCKVKK
ncbi:MAG TPA: type II secretion system protein [Dehalococcoidales bacterium]|nr:type II secretion system protein [Dehalococcoidales bacterium]